VPQSSDPASDNARTGNSKIRELNIIRELVLFENKICICDSINFDNSMSNHSYADFVQQGTPTGASVSPLRQTHSFVLPGAGTARGGRVEVTRPANGNANGMNTMSTSAAIPGTGTAAAATSGSAAGGTGPTSWESAAAADEPEVVILPASSSAAAAVSSGSGSGSGSPAASQPQSPSAAKKEFMVVD
jgi:hypothetical protein